MISPLEIKRLITKYANENQDAIVPQGLRGAITGLLNAALNGDENRHYVMYYLFGHPSSKHLTAGQWYALSRWVSPAKGDMEDAVWTSREGFNREARSVLDAFTAFGGPDKDPQSEMPF